MSSGRDGISPRLLHKSVSAEKRRILSENAAIRAVGTDTNGKRKTKDVDLNARMNHVNYKGIEMHLARFGYTWGQIPTQEVLERSYQSALMREAETASRPNLEELTLSFRRLTKFRKTLLTEDEMGWPLNCIDSF